MTVFQKDDLIENTRSTTKIHIEQEKKNIAIVSNMQWKIKILTNKNTIH